MRKIQLDGKKIKELRDGRDRAATQKEFAHEIGISERRLRAIENGNAPVTTDVADRVARALNKPLQFFLARDEGLPPPPVPTSPPGAEPIKAARKEQLLPRFDEGYAQAISDEAFLFEKIRPCRSLVSHILLSLNTETSAYVEELLSILSSLTWDRLGPMTQIDPLEEIALRRRIRELLVLLKGNDVWLYFYDNMRTLPESFEVQPETVRRDYEFQAVVAFGPPGEYGETSVKVPIDRGQPSILTW